MRSVTDHVFGSSSAEVPSGATSVVKGNDYDGNRVGAPKSWFTDPFALLDSLGLGYKSSPSGLSYATLRQMAESNVIIGAIHQTRVHQVASFCRPQQNKYSIGFRIDHKDKQRRLMQGEIDRIKHLEGFMLHCGRDYNPDRDNLEKCSKKLVRDRLTYDQMCHENVLTYGGKPYEFYAVPGSTIRLASPKKRKGTPLRGRENRTDVKFIQIIDGVVVNTYSRADMAFSVANPRTDLRAWGYGYSELEMLIKTVTRHLWAEEWNSKAFSQGSTTKGMLNIKGNIPPQQLDAFKRQWLAQVSGVSNAWRTPIINSNDDIQWIDLQPTNQEMGYQQWMEYLIKIACAIYLIDPAEINFDIRGGVAQNPMFMSTNEAQQKISQDRGLRPLLYHVQDHYNNHVLRPLDPNYEFVFVGLDAKTEEQAIELRMKELQSYKTLNEVREAEQLPPVPHGDIVPNPSYIGYRNQKEMMDQQQQQPGMMGGGGAPGQEGVAGFPGADADHSPGTVENKAREAIEQELGEEKKPKRKRRADRHVPVPSEEWETTYTASVHEDDLRKALEPLSALIGDQD